MVVKLVTQVQILRIKGKVYIYIYVYGSYMYICMCNNTYNNAFECIYVYIFTFIQKKNMYLWLNFSMRKKKLIQQSIIRYTECYGIYKLYSDIHKNI